MAKQKKTEQAKRKFSNRLKHAIRELFLRPPSLLGLFLATNFAASSLTPSLMPRTWLLQGIATGLSLIIGYGIGTSAMWVWRYLRLPELKPGSRAKKIIVGGLAAFNALSLLLVLIQTGTWQNQVRVLVGADLSDATYPFRITFLALATALSVLLLGRMIRIFARFLTVRLQRFVPRRVALVLAGFILFWLLGTAATGALRSAGLRMANNIFSVADRGIKDGSVEPTSSFRSAGPGSLVTWDDLGKQGKQFVGSGPTRADIAQNSPDAKEPIRAYASLQNGDKHEQRAQVVLDELIRMDAFSRKYLLLTTTTGTGYLDPNAVDTFEHVVGGDSAIAGMQYSYLPSWIALLADTETPKQAAVALFNAVHGHWQNLDPDTRPQLYLYGLSLGAYGSQASISRVELLNDPVDGALWAGPPFVSEFWNRVTDNRDPGSPEWLPVYQNGKVIRFTDGEQSLVDGYSTQWQDNRIIYLQYPTDPVVFFSNDYILERPEWLDEPRGRGVIPDMDWYPFVTYFQLAFDLANAAGSAEGYGHLYSADDYVEAWQALIAE